MPNLKRNKSFKNYLYDQCFLIHVFQKCRQILGKTEFDQIAAQLEVTMFPELQILLVQREATL